MLIPAYYSRAQLYTAQNCAEWQSIAYFVALGYALRNSKTNRAIGQKMFVSIQEAIKLTGKSRSTFQRYIANGKLSKTEKGIDTSELIRVFGELTLNDNQATDKSNNQADLSREQWLMNQIDLLRAELKQTREEAARREELANEREKRLLNLLEHQTGTQSPTNTSGGLFSKLFK